MEEVRFCKDCRFCKRSLQLFRRWGYYFAKCTHPKSTSYDRDLKLEALVDGKEPKPKYNFCSSMRSSGECGGEGKLYEPKEKVAAVIHKLDRNPIP